jgi:hypothetical protein
VFLHCSSRSWFGRRDHKMYTNQRNPTRRTPQVVSRLFQHSPRQLRIARERLDKADLKSPALRQPADPHSIGRDRHELEVKPPKPGHTSTKYIKVSSDLVGTGAIVEPKYEDPQPREVKESASVKSSLHFENGFFQPTVCDQHNSSRKLCDGSAHGAKGHLTGAGSAQLCIPCCLLTLIFPLFL